MADGDLHPRVIRSTPRLTRDEIVNQTFAPSFRGLSEAAVRAFLRRIADEYEAVRTRQDELFAEIDRLEAQLAQPPVAAPEQDLLAAVGDETARVLRSAKESAEEIRRGAEERASDLLREAHDEARLLREQTEQAATERTRQADDTSAEVLREAERLARELQEGAEARLAEFEAQAEAEARAEVESARRRSRELIAEAEAMRDRMLSELARRRDALESQLDMLRGGRERLLDAYKVVKTTLDEATDALRTVDARPSSDAKRPRVTSAALPAQHSAPDVEQAESSPPPVDAIVSDPSGGGEMPDAPSGLAGEQIAPADQPAVPPRVGSFALGELETPVHDEEAPRPRRERSPRPAPPLEKFTVDQPSGVRVLGALPEPGTPPPEQAPEPVVDESTHGDEAADAHAPSFDGEADLDSHHVPELSPQSTRAPSLGEPGRHETVDEIFARIRAEQSAAASEPPPAEEPTAIVEPDPAPSAEAPADSAPQDGESVPAEPTVVEAPIVPRDGMPGPEVALRRRRDEGLDPLVEEVVRAVKRVVRDEQNVVLQSVREHRGVPSADSVLPAVEDQDDAFADATADLLNEACVLGEAVAREFGVAGGINGDGARRRARAREIAAGLARELMDPLRGKLGDALRDAASGDESQVGERVRGRYREWKGQRIDTACRNALATAFARGIYDSVPEGMPLRWVTTDPSPCPDCADNALEQTPRGHKFPTGHTMPPAHAGCHCLVLPAEVSADLEVV